MSMCHVISSEWEEIERDQLGANDAHESENGGREDDELSHENLLGEMSQPHFPNTIIHPYGVLVKYPCRIPQKRLNNRIKVIVMMLCNMGTK